MRIDFGRRVFGVAALAIAACNVARHDFNIWEQIQPLGNTPYRDIPVYVAALLEIFGGLAIQWRRTAQAGAVALGVIYLLFTLLSVPAIIHDPLVYNSWGDFFEQLSLVAGAIIVYASFAPSDSAWARTVMRVGYYCFAVCVVSFTLEQLFYLGVTASFVPKWIPPGQMFWALTTTLAFALAAISLLTGRQAPLASKLLTLMLVLFGLLVWLPRLFINPHSQVNLAGNTENLAVAGAAWIVADFLERAGRSFFTQSE
ncbi:MAG: hypothetical protein JOZ43_03960 [Acidobacteriales bacterium]|nr:hypothetical protein [Terriglobales bacterium]